ncbi:HipA domain-containing protein [Halomonas sp. WWR20]
MAVIRRFGRTGGGGRIPYVSAATMLQTSGRDEVHAYTELVDVLLQSGSDPIADIHELWRRLVFNFLICNTDDHLRNMGLLYDARRRGWRLAPAFDLNPMPGCAGPPLWSAPSAPRPGRCAPNYHSTGLIDLPGDCFGARFIGLDALADQGRRPRDSHSFPASRQLARFIVGWLIVS